MRQAVGESRGSKKWEEQIEISLRIGNLIKFG